MAQSQKGISWLVGRGLRLWEEFVLSLFRGRRCVLEAVREDEEALTASSVGCTCLSCCAPRPRCDSWGETSSGPPWSPRGAWAGRTQVHIATAQEENETSLKVLKSRQGFHSTITMWGSCSLKVRWRKGAWGHNKVTSLHVTKSSLLKAHLRAFSELERCS